MDSENPDRKDGEVGGGGMVEEVIDSASAVGGLLDLGFRKSCGLKLLPIFYVLVVVGMLFTVVRTSLAVMNVAVGTGLWGLLVGLVMVAMVAIGLRIVLECVAKYLRS